MGWPDRRLYWNGRFPIWSIKTGGGGGVQIHLLQIHVLQIHLLQIHVFRSSWYFINPPFTNPCFTNPPFTNPVHVLQIQSNLVHSIFYNMPITVAKSTYDRDYKSEKKCEFRSLILLFFKNWKKTEKWHIFVCALITEPLVSDLIEIGQIRRGVWLEKGAPPPLPNKKYCGFKARILGNEDQLRMRRWFQLCYLTTSPTHRWAQAIQGKHFLLEKRFLFHQIHTTQRQDWDRPSVN